MTIDPTYNSWFYIVASHLSNVPKSQRKLALSNLKAITLNDSGVEAILEMTDSLAGHEIPPRTVLLGHEVPPRSKKAKKKQVKPEIPPRNTKPPKKRGREIPVRG